jgi:Asp-tRNA(Asn)/Glu-tRNA(Gln) amidotransferase A subunit family amidase
MQGIVVPTTSYGMPQSPIVPAAGPLCNSVDDVKNYLTAMWQDSYFSSNQTVAPIHFREKEYQQTLVKKLKIGYLSFKNASGDY